MSTTTFAPATSSVDVTPSSIERGRTPAPPAEPVEPHPRDSLRSSTARIATHAARILLGLTFFVFGLDGFLHFIPQPTEPPSEAVMALVVGFMKAGYMFPLIKGTEVAVGTLLLANRLVPLALVVIAPVIVNIFAFHAFLAPSGLVIASALVVLEISLAWAHRAAYRPLFAARPATARAR